MATSEPLAAHTAASRPAGPAASGPNSAIGAHDPLSRCLEEFVALTGRPASAAALVAGLPLENGLLSPESLRRALENHGYATLLTRVPLKSVKSYQLPAIVLMAEGDACIWLSRRDRDISIRDPLTGSDVVGKIHDLENGYDGACLFARRSGAHDYLPDQGVDRGKGHWFWSVIRKLWPTYGYVFLAAALINILALASPIFMMNVYDRVLPNKAIPTLWVLAAGFALALLFDYLLKSLRGYLIDGAGRRADVLLASHIYSHVLGIQMSAKPATTGSFASHLKEFENVREFFTSSTIVTIADMAFFGLFLLVIWNIGGVVAVVPAAAALMLLVFGLMFQIPLHRAANRHAAETAQRHSLLVESIAALETVKAIRAESHLQRIWEGLVGMTSQTVEVVRRLNSSLANLAGFIQQFVSLGVIVVGAYLFEKGEISMGGVIACVMLAGRAVAPLSQFAMVLARSQQSFASLSTLNKIMQMPSERPPGKAFISRPVSDTGIQFQNVDFSYPGSQQPVLAGVSIIIRPGEKVGIIGKIGSGKTTLGRLLTKLYEPSKGAILMGGVDIRQYHPHEIRRVVGLLGQDAELFHGTIRSNVLMANPRAADDELIRVCRLAGVEDFVRRNPAGYDMQVGERGSALSGGQRQSVALARLLIGQPKVIFLDEPSSAMDLASERVMIEQLKNAAQPDQTVIVATHRYSMLDLVERLIVINNGKIAADGPRDQVLELLKKQAGAPRS